MSLRIMLMMALGLGILYGLFTVGLPFLLAMVAAVLLEPVTGFFVRGARMNRVVAATLVNTLFIMLALSLFYLIGLNVITEFIAFGRKAPAYLNDASVYLDRAFPQTQLFYESLSPDMAEQLQLGVEKGTSSLIDALKSVLTEVSGFFLSMARGIPSLFLLFFMFVIALYLFSYSLPMLKTSFLSIFEDRSRSKIEAVLDSLRQAVFGLIRAQMIMAVLTYLITFLGLLLLRAEYPLAIALLVMAMEFVPVVGTGLVFLPWAGYQLLAGHTGFGTALLILFLALTLFRRIVEPKILSDAVGIGALSALISLYVGFELMGVTGLFLGPIVVIVYQAMRKAGLLQFSIHLD